MTPEDQRIAISEACGWEISPPNLSWPNPYWLDPKAKILRVFSELPDYLHDLNAMHEAEKVLDAQGKQKERVKALWEVCGTMEDRWNDLAGLIGATAAQRAEAFLRAIGNWIE